MNRAMTWWVIAWLLLAVGQRALGRSMAAAYPAPLLKVNAADATRAVRANLERVRDGMRLKWISEKRMRFQVQSSNDRTAWRTVGGAREGTGGSDSVVVPASGPRYVRVDSPKLPAPVCGNKFYKRAPSNYWRLFQKKIPNGSDFIGPRNHSRLPGRAPGLHRLDRPNRTPLRLIRLSEDRRMSGRTLFPGHKEGNWIK